MKKILVSLVSEQTIPNILIAAHYKPDDFWSVSTEKMERERKVECIVNTLKLKGILSPAKSVEKVIVDQDSLTDCAQKIKSLIEKIDSEVEYILNMTGGNKVMAIASYEVFKTSGQKIIIGYIPLGKNEFIQIFPETKPLKTYEIKERLNLEEYLSSYGFGIQNKNSLEKVKTNALTRRESSQWILDNYEQVKGVLGFLYKNLKDARGQKGYQLSAAFDRDPANIELEILEKHGFEIEDRLISRDMKKDEIAYLTGGWFEEYVFNEIYVLVQQGMLDDARIGVQIESHSRTSNDLDIAFMKDNSFYHIECKTLGNENEEEQFIIREEIYKKGAISTLLGKGEKRAMICTTQSQINESLTNRAQAYGIEIFTLEQVRNLKSRLKKRFG